MSRIQIAIALSAVVGASTFAFSQQVPATQPSPARDSRPAATTRESDGFENAGDGMDRNDHGPGDGQFIRGGGNGGGGGNRGFQQLTDRDREEAKQFMKTNAPIRYAATQSLPERQKSMVEDFSARLYVNLRRSKDKEPELYKIVVERTKLDDQIFGLLNDYRKAPADQQPAQKTKLREKLAARETVNLKERKLRLDKLATTLADEQARLSADSNPDQFDDLVSKRLDALLNSRDNNLMPPPPDGRHPHDHHGEDQGPGGMK